MQQEDVQRVRLDPLAVVEEQRQVPQRPGDRHTEGRLDGLTGAHLVRHGTDAADARGDVGGLVVGPAAQERLEEPGRLVDLQPEVGDAAAAGAYQQGALALDPGQAADADGSVRHPPASPGASPAASSAAWMNCSSVALKVR
ncbi:hypothetical protein GCM10027161_28480 [Microbispora hainanensis]